MCRSQGPLGHWGYAQPWNLAQSVGVWEVAGRRHRNQKRRRALAEDVGYGCV